MSQSPKKSQNKNILSHGQALKSFSGSFSQKHFCNLFNLFHSRKIKKQNKSENSTLSIFAKLENYLKSLAFEFSRQKNDDFLI